MSLKKYIAIRVLLAIPTVIFLTSIVFVILHIIPGDPVDAIVGLSAPESMKNAMRQSLGLNQPIYIQYIQYITGVFTGNLGTSILTREPVATELASFFPATVELLIGSLIVMIGVGIPMGLFSATRANSKLDFASRIYNIGIYTIPVFWLGMIFQLVFGVYLRVLPVTGMGATPPHIYTGIYVLDSIISGNPGTFLSDLESLILPSLSLGLILAGVIARLTRSYMLDTLKSDYATAARARGLRNSTINLSYGLKNALIPLVTIVGLQVAALLGGAILTETTFSWPGIGLYISQRISYRDYDAVQGAVVLFAIMVVVVNTVVDVIYGLIDPRVKV